MLFKKYTIFLVFIFQVLSTTCLAAGSYSPINDINKDDSLYSRAPLPVLPPQVEAFSLDSFQNNSDMIQAVIVFENWLNFYENNIKNYSYFKTVLQRSNEYLSSLKHPQGPKRKEVIWDNYEKLVEAYYQNPNGKIDHFVQRIESYKKAILKQNPDHAMIAKKYYQVALGYVEKIDRNIYPELHRAADIYGKAANEYAKEIKNYGGVSHKLVKRAYKRLLKSYQNLLSEYVKIGNSNISPTKIQGTYRKQLDREKIAPDINEDIMKGKNATKIRRSPLTRSGSSFEEVLLLRGSTEETKTVKNLLDPQKSESEKGREQRQFSPAPELDLRTLDPSLEGGNLGESKEGPRPSSKVPELELGSLDSREGVVGQDNNRASSRESGSSRETVLQALANNVKSLSPRPNQGNDSARVRPGSQDQEEKSPERGRVGIDKKGASEVEVSAQPLVKRRSSSSVVQSVEGGNLGESDEGPRPSSKVPELELGSLDSREGVVGQDNNRASSRESGSSRETALQALANNVMSLSPRPNQGNDSARVRPGSQDQEEKSPESGRLGIDKKGASEVEVTPQPLVKRRSSSSVVQSVEGGNLGESDEGTRPSPKVPKLQLGSLDSQEGVVGQDNNRASSRESGSSRETALQVLANNVKSLSPRPNQGNDSARVRPGSQDQEEKSPESGRLGIDKKGASEVEVSAQPLVKRRSSSSVVQSVEGGNLGESDEGTRPSSKVPELELGSLDSQEGVVGKGNNSDSSRESGSPRPNQGNDSARVRPGSQDQEEKSPEMRKGRDR